MTRNLILLGLALLILTLATAGWVVNFFKWLLALPKLVEAESVARSEKERPADPKAHGTRQLRLPSA